MEGLFGFIQKSSQRTPGKTFIQRQDQTWTYSDVYLMARNVSGYLPKCGVQRGDTVIVFCDNSIQYIAAFFGILGTNAVVVPVNPARMTESLLYIVEKCSPRLVLACDSTIGRLDRVGKSLPAEIVNIDRIIRQDYTDADRDSSEATGAPSGSDGIPSGSDGVPSDIQDNIPDENDPAVILFTSGTTALPKGVTLTHANLTANTRAIVEYLHLTSEDSVLMTLPFTYSYGNSVLLTHVCAGASIVIENSTTYPYKILEGIREHRVSGFSTVGSYINLMLKCIRNSDTGENFLGNLRYITFAGESTNIDDIRFINKRYPNIKAYVMYGQTEASARLSYLEPERLHDKIGSIGKGLCNIELKVVDEAGREIQPGEIGEIIARGPSIMQGYWKDPAATEEVLKCGWLHTGDNATVDEDGFIFIKGRNTDMIKHMGHRISPVEIENVINSCAYVRESAAVESTFGALTVIKAYIVPEGDFPMEDIQKYIYSKLPIYMRPQIIEAIEQLPRTDSGKIKRSTLRGNK